MIKRFITFLSIPIAALALSCCNDDLTPPSEPETTTHASSSLNRSMEDAIKIALQSRDAYLGTSTRSGDKGNIVNANQVFVKTKAATRSGNDLDSLYYVVNFSGDSGFAIVAANKNEEALIAITKKGYFTGEPTGVYGFDLYMEETEKRLAASSGVAPQEGPGEMVINTCDTVSVIHEEVPELIDISWHQYAPFNKYCSTEYGAPAPAGCPAIAVAQAMAYYEYPEEIDITFPSSIDKVSLSWEEMIPHTEQHSNCEYCDQNALLVREIGERLGIQYGPSTSGINFPETIKYNVASLGYTCDSYAPFEIRSVIKSLDNRHPVILTGLESNGYGHVWNVFGYKRSYQHIDYYTQTGSFRPKYAGSSKTEIISVSLNYGYGGKYDGEYIAYHRKFESGPKMFDGETTDTVLVSIFNAEYNNHVKMLTNFKPIEQ